MHSGFPSHDPIMGYLMLSVELKKYSSIPSFLENKKIFIIEVSEAAIHWFAVFCDYILDFQVTIQ